MENNNQTQRNNRPPRQRSGQGQRPNRGPNNQSGPRGQNQPNGGLRMPGAAQSRGASLRAQKRAQSDAQKIANQYASAEMQPQERRANVIVDDFDKLKITFLGGQQAIGEKNMQVIEWQNDAVVLDCGNDLGLELPGVNYAVADPSYLESIKHKLKGYIVSHGHLDHIGG